MNQKHKSGLHRLNLTVPQELYARLDKYRDRVNISKLLTIALARELDMLESGRIRPDDDWYYSSPSDTLYSARFE